jgi:hypothetical protein
VGYNCFVTENSVSDNVAQNTYNDVMKIMKELGEGEPIMQPFALYYTAFRSLNFS